MAADVLLEDVFSTGLIGCEAGIDLEVEGLIFLCSELLLFVFLFVEGNGWILQFLEP